MISRTKYFIVAAILITGLVFSLSQLNEQPDNINKLSKGKQLANVYCSGCHLESPPSILPKQSWEMTLAYMGYMLGMDNVDYLSNHPEFARENVIAKQRFLNEDNLVPATPLLSESDWDALRYYYVESAPTDSLPQIDKPILSWQLPQFSIIQSDYHIDTAVTTMVHIREETNQAYIGDTGANTLGVLGADGQLEFEPLQYGRALMPVDIEFTVESALVASVGDLIGDYPAHEKVATISRLPIIDQRIASSGISVVVDDIYRMADMEVADLNGDGTLDFVVCGFGGREGNVAWFESQSDGSYLEHELINRPGAVRAQLHDFNEDNHLDIAVLMSDAREGFYILINNGVNEFKINTVFETHPSYGHTYFELQDFNNDGLMDILTVNGDNVDSDPYNTLKNFHGIRIYLNQGDLRFNEAYFYPMYGAFGAKAADFDNDGDLDIAGISFYPDYALEKRESFVFLQNNGDLEFSAHTNQELVNGRWMTIDAGDLDGDGDIDILLGGAYIPVGMFAYGSDIFNALAESAPSILVLKNNLN